MRIEKCHEKACSPSNGNFFTQLQPLREQQVCSPAQKVQPCGRHLPLRTSILAVAILLLASRQGLPETLVVDGVRAFSVLSDFKNFTKKAQRSELLVYPERPSDAPMRTAYESEKAIGRPVDLPARKSKTSISLAMRIFFAATFPTSPDWRIAWIPSVIAIFGGRKGQWPSRMGTTSCNCC